MWLVGNKAIHRQAAFSMIEMLVVVAILGMVASVTVGALSRTDRLTFNQVRSEAMGLLRLAKTQAVSQGVTQRLVVDTQERAIRLADRRQLTLPAFMEMQLTTGFDHIHDETGVVQFFSDGTANDATLTLQGKDQTVVIKIDGLTGIIKQVSPS